MIEMTREAEIIITLPNSQDENGKPRTETWLWKERGGKHGNTLLGLLYWKWHPSTRLVREHE